MQMGDRIEVELEILFVRKIVEATQTAIAVNTLGEVVSLDLEDAHRVLDNPATQWPFVVVKKAAQIITIEWGGLRRRSRTLFSLVDWIQPEPRQQNGSVFFNPSLGLSFGDVLVAKLPGGKMARIDIPMTFGTTVQKTRKAAPAKPEDRTAYQRLLDEDDFG